MTAIPLGQSQTLRNGKNLAILAFGSMVEPCRTVAEKLDATLINMRFVKPLDREAILSLLTERKTLERIEHTLKTGKPLRN